MIEDSKWNPFLQLSTALFLIRTVLMSLDKCSPKLDVIAKEFSPIEEKPNLKLFVLEPLIKENTLYAYYHSRTSYYNPIRRGSSMGRMSPEEIRDRLTSS